MLRNIVSVKKKLESSISQICEASWMFSKHPGHDFTRIRKLPFQKVISCLLAMEGGALTTELLKFFGCSTSIASSSALIQQRRKLSDVTFPMLFSLFVKKTDTVNLYKGLRLLAADGSDIQIPVNPHHPDSYFPGTDNQSAYNLLHLDAMYDLLQHTYMDAVLLGQRKANERNSLCNMVDRSTLENVLVIADRGYEGFNLMAHIQEKGWFYLIRIQDIFNSRGIAAGLELPDTDEFDMFVDLNLTTRQNKRSKELCKNRNRYRFVPSSNTFDYLPRTNHKYDPLTFYSLPFRIVRFKITEDTYETVVTNLNAVAFPPEELKKLYNVRWGIETSFRELKYTVGLLHFHAKKTNY